MAVGCGSSILGGTGLVLVAVLVIAAVAFLKNRGKK